MTTRHIHPTLALCAALVASATVGCSRATSGSATAADGTMFRGVYETGPDRSVFLPCGSDERWYVWAESTPARELKRLTIAQDLQSPSGGMLPRGRATDVRRAYAEVLGDTVAVTKSQPAIPYDLELRITRVMAVQPAQSAVCP